MTDNIHSGLRGTLSADIAPLLLGVYQDIIDEIAAASTDADDNSGGVHLTTLVRFATSQLSKIATMHELAALYSARFSHAQDDSERNAAILDFAGKLGADRQQLRRDAKALSNFFDGDAVTERYRRRVGERERALAFALERAGHEAGELLAGNELEHSSELFSRDLATLLEKARAYQGDSRVRQAAHRALRLVAEKSTKRLSGFWIDMAVRDTRRVALDADEAAWAQCDAISTLLALSPQSLISVLEKRLAATSDRGSPTRQDNRIFVRRHIARLLCTFAGKNKKLDTFLKRLVNDRDGAVRQAVAESLPLLPPKILHGHIARLRVDRDPQVRAMVFADVPATADACGIDAYLPHLVRVLSRDEDTFVLRIAIDGAFGLGQWAAASIPDRSSEVIGILRSSLAEVKQRIESPKIRRWASEASEKLWLLSDKEARAIAAVLTAHSARLKEGQSRLASDLQEHVFEDPDKLGRVMAVLAQQGFGFDLTQGSRPKLQKGDKFSRRLWRTLFELRISATDKRQAFLHTIGRSYRGTISAPSARLAELAPTKVPGEPLFQSEDGNWRNFVPLLDQVLGAIDLGKPIKVYTSEGITTITPPTGVLRRFKTFWSISEKFAALADLRNRTGGEYSAALRKYGVELEFAPHSDAYVVGESGPEVPADTSVTRFFSAGGILAAAPIFWDNAVAYFATVFANTLAQLALFLVIVCLWFFGRHIVLGYHAKRVRKEIPLMLGGWGTRGKSGTERLKAGLINALGAPLVSKTTGCEAMFLNGESFGELTEMFLFRPYDKATIWEQYSLIKIARRLKARVFLWECMGLNPTYVHVLQQDWMRDDIGTITNTYPDHEDVQGPAGRNIPEVMCEFIPQDSILLTTEEEMLPILQEGSDKVGTRLRAINWKQAGLIHQRLLDRFPYEEHPYNIALVTAMGDELGLEADYCIKEMSDRVVADLGVLKTYPRSLIDGRILEYVMGNSANERFGAMGNWDRMGFAEHDLAKDPEIFVTTVVNNRADRVPRSRVFARLLVNDISVDRHFLIGSNIEGLVSFIAEEWDTYALSVNLEDGLGTAAEQFDQLVRRQRVPINPEQLLGRLQAMVDGVGGTADPAILSKAFESQEIAQILKDHSIEHGDDIAAYFEQQAGFFSDYQKLRGAISSSQAADQHLAEVRDFLKRVFMAKIVPVRDFYIKGEAVVRLIARNSPPGLVNRIMGMQNIKGTGLDLVYRFQAWEAANKACEQALDSDAATSEKGIAALAAFQEFGALSDTKVKETIARLAERPNLPQAFGKPQLETILSRLIEQQAAYQSVSQTDEPENGKGWEFLGKPKKYFLELAEGILDGGDAVNRKRAADRIYEALIAEQISSGRAAVELKYITARQKGGWMTSALDSIRNRLSGWLVKSDNR
ncbi:hypothetical protein GCM10023115_04350 [Pontixanthobacter gangjinensis]|uniref:Poly-gamma-glutamate synthase PgsB/CapB n=1 Tax=Pontixanthobacter gangjinensis TaxID=1028742 RepID=A0A6I4SIZ4_9SPHN|nr:hypothetical protein [Pontixanthobacter gangjinensis]MXO55689.1 hypothetical protein [Pontixanthobacter gangjinensis]